MLTGSQAPLELLKSPGFPRHRTVPALAGIRATTLQTISTRFSGTSDDSNGNLKTDTFHTYERNEFSKVKSFDRNGTNCATSGECLVYDAPQKGAHFAFAKWWARVSQGPCDLFPFSKMRTSSANVTQCRWCGRRRPARISAA